MANSQADDAFVQELQHALHSLYDPAALRKSRLLNWLSLEGRSNPPSALRETLTAAIQALKPSGATPPDSTAWRIYWILTYRYVEQSSQATTAANLGLSDRQLRRLERVAEQTLAGFLWDQYRLAAKASQPPGTTAGDDRQGAGAPAEVPSREQELEWLHESLPTQSADVGEVIDAVLKLVEPLARASGVRIECRMAEELPLIAGQLPLARQALLNLLSATVQSVPGGEVSVEAVVQPEAAQPGGIGIHVRTLGGADTPPAGPVAEALEMAQQFTALFGGALQVAGGQAAGEAWTATLILPTSEQIEVLVIDDNSDTLRLMQRYLVGTRYRFLGAHDPEEALALAATHSPRIIVLDVMMPGIDDWELLGRLRTHPRTSAVPIIISTILPQEQLARALGAADFVRKPVSRQALLAALDRQRGPL